MKGERKKSTNFDFKFSSRELVTLQLFSTRDNEMII